MKRKDKFTFDDLERVADAACSLSEAFLDEESSRRIRDVKNAIFPKGNRGRNLKSKGRYLPFDDSNGGSNHVKSKKKR